MEWTYFIAGKQLAINPPDSVWLMSETSGSLIDQVGTVDLAPGGTSQAAYAVSVPGWTRKAIQSADASGVVFENRTDPALPAIGTSSLTVLMMYATATPPAGLRTALIGGCCGGYVEVGVDTSSHFMLSAGSVQTIGTVNHVGDVIPVILKLDRTSSKQVLIAAKELLSQTAALGNQKGMFLGAANRPAPDARWLYMAAWYGSNAEMSDAKLQALVTALGW
jgi:hypothetical protein